MNHHNIIWKFVFGIITFNVESAIGSCEDARPERVAIPDRFPRSCSRRMSPKDVERLAIFTLSDPFSPCATLVGRMVSAALWYGGASFSTWFRALLAESSLRRFHRFMEEANFTTGENLSLQAIFSSLLVADFEFSCFDRC